MRVYQSPEMKGGKVQKKRHPATHTEQSQQVKAVFMERREMAKNMEPVYFREGGGEERRGEGSGDGEGTQVTSPYFKKLCQEA